VSADRTCPQPSSPSDQFICSPRSLLRKYDDVIQLCRDRRIDLPCLTETWHDADSAVLGRLRRAGYNVVDRPRLRAADDDLSVNHGGVIVMSAADVSLSPIAVTQPTTFDFVCAQTWTTLKIHNR